MTTRKSWSQIALERWPDAPGKVLGTGPYAVLGCKGTVSLWADHDTATGVAMFLDSFACGGRCCGSHIIVHLEQGEPTP